MTRRCSVLAAAASLAASAAAAPAAAASAAAATAALPGVCLVYSDGQGNAFFGRLVPGNGTIEPLLPLNWAGLPEGITAGGTVDGQQRWFYNVGIGSGPDIVDVMAVLSWVPELRQVTVTYADLPSSLPPSAARYAGSVAFANVAFNPDASTTAPLVGIMQPDSGDETWFVGGSWDPFTGDVAAVFGNFTAMWASDDAYKYGCAAWDPATRVFYQCVGTTGAAEAVQAVRFRQGGDPYAPLEPVATIGVPTGQDILAVVFSATLNGTAVLASPLVGATGPSTLFVQDPTGAAYTPLRVFDASLRASTLGGMAQSRDGTTVAVLLNEVDCRQAPGCAVVSYVSLLSGKELARVRLASNTTLVADVQVCEL